MTTTSFEQLRTAEFARLDDRRCVYLDYTGAALYPASLPVRHTERLLQDVYGNPHADAPASRRSTELLERARADVLHFFDADPAVFDVVFTANASGALRILAEAFPFTRGSVFALSADNHNSVHGIRQAARRRRARVQYIPLDRELRPTAWDAPTANAPSLLAYPAQSNFSGVRHPHHIIEQAHRHGFHVALDAAAYVPTSPLSLRRIAPDFVAISFYKMFGWPTGVGALVARKDALAMLRRSYFAGGTVQYVSVQNGDHRLRTGASGFEDGTPSFLSLGAVSDGLQWLEGLGMDDVRAHVQQRTAQLIERLRAVDGLVLYGPGDTQDRGGTVAFNLVRDGVVVPYEAVEAAAAQRDVSIRGGCFCNPGAGEAAFELSARDARRCRRGTAEFDIARFRECMGGAPVGALRASVGIPTTVADLDALVAVLRSI
ncbi:MAG TPA: aminotransferase class V-fold PLP-dependent enzyme [Longimicrobiales bacterium]|nr:aminotransferase class V-fold PLP-dependent enzyme [Longimicrobiales bacterium]